MKPTPDPEYLRERLRYVPWSGKLYWREHASMSKQWNTKHAGNEAFTARHPSGYCEGTLDGVHYKAHHIVWAWYHGEWPADDIDHQDHDSANNRIKNLRVTDHVGNMRNKKKYRTNSSGATGVRMKRGRWEARLGWKHVGSFNTFEEAVEARKCAEANASYHPNHGK